MVFGGDVLVDTHATNTKARVLPSMEPTDVESVDGER
jgi:hypothetical protein